MKRKNEKLINQEFEYEGDLYRVVERGECSNRCAFYDFCEDKLIKQTIGSCVESQRSDKKNVMVVLLNE